jgi:hypothetical protein
VSTPLLAPDPADPADGLELVLDVLDPPPDTSDGDVELVAPQPTSKSPAVSRMAKGQATPIRLT